MASDLVEIGETIAEYVTYGVVREDGQFDRHFGRIGELASLLPKQAGGVLFRVVRLTEEQSDLLRAGKLELDRRSHSSWSRELISAERLARQKKLDNPDTPAIAIVRRTFAPEEILVDVHALYLHLGWNHADVDEWDRYVDREREVVVRDLDAYTVDQKDVVHSWTGKMSDLVRPFAGDRIWLPAIEDFGEISCVSVQDDGSFLVDLVDGSEVVAVWDHSQDCWEASPSNDPAPFAN